MKLKIYFTAIVFLLCYSCNNSKKKINYEQSQYLESIIKNKINYDLQNSSNNSAIIILHKVDCICTEENIQLSEELINSRLYNNYHFIVVVKGENHKFLKKASKATLDKIYLIEDIDDSFMKQGYMSTTDRIIIYDHGLSTEYFDMKITKIAELRKHLKLT